MRRDPPEAVKNQLRAEVGFGCPVYGCRLPFLEFHHFDPPWRDRQHHEPDGMVALCVEHHKKADRGVFSKDQLRAFKKSKTSVEEIRGKFDWAGPRQLIRFGGVYFNPHRVFSAANPAGLPPGTLDFGVGEQGLLELSFVLCAPSGKRLATMDRNTIIADPEGFQSFNVNASATKIKAKVTGQDAVLEIETQRLTRGQLDLILDNDFKRYDQFLKDQSRINPAFRAAYYGPVRDVDGAIRSVELLTDASSPTGLIPSDVATGRHREILVSSINQFIDSGYLGDDGIPFLDVRQFKTRSIAGPISITGGVNVGNLGHGPSCYFVDIYG
jgi:hypothetical protein